MAGNPINPKFCLTDSSAAELHAMLSKDRPNIIVQLHPLMGNTQAPLVPWLAFPTETDPVNINAGQLADSFTHGKPPDLAYSEMLQHIDRTISDQTS